MTGEGLTIEKLQDAIAKLPPRPANPLFNSVIPFGGVPIYPQADWPTEPELIGYHIFPAHPLVRWFYAGLRRMGFNASPWVRLPMIARRERSPIMCNGALYLSLSQHQILKTECVS